MGNGCGLKIDTQKSYKRYGIAGFFKRNIHEFLAIHEKICSQNLQLDQNCTV